MNLIEEYKNVDPKTDLTIKIVACKNYADPCAEIISVANAKIGQFNFVKIINVTLGSNELFFTGMNYCSHHELTQYYYGEGALLQSPVAAASS